jgi:hypothetical protein
MTENEWLACNDLRSLLPIFYDKGSQRKRWLFIIACWRSIWHLLPEICQEIVVAFERFVEKEAGPGELVALLDGFDPARVALGNLSGAIQAAHAIGQLPSEWRWREVSDDNRYSFDNRHMVYYVSRSTAEALAKSIPWAMARRFQAELLKDITGNPFHPPLLLLPDVVAWNDRTVPKIAAGIYAEYAFERMPILHDALLDAGCADEALLTHCRNPEGHVRGCWALDLILGKS